MRIKKVNKFWIYVFNNEDKENFFIAKNKPHFLGYAKLNFQKIGGASKPCPMFTVFVKDPTVLEAYLCSIVNGKPVMDRLY